jgi:hypothetical protein
LAVLEKLMSGPQISHKPAPVIWVVLIAGLSAWGAMAFLFAIFFPLMFPV